MDKCCSMMGCNNNKNNQDIKFFQFPSNPDICRIWAESCGDPFLITNYDDQKFSMKSICSWHFTSDDFIDRELQRLKPNAVPSFTQSIYVKTELDDYPQIAYTYIKDEPIEDEEFNYNLSNDVPENFLTTSWMDSCSDIRTIRVAEKYNYEIEKLIKTEQSFQYRKTTRVRKKKTKTPEQLAALRLKQKLRTAERRKQETKAESDIRKYKDAVRIALRRSKETEKERFLRRRKNTLYVAYKRSMETDEERAARRLKDRIRAAKKRKQEREEKARISKYNDALRASLSLSGQHTKLLDKQQDSLIQTCKTENIFEDATMEFCCE